MFQEKLKGMSRSNVTASDLHKVLRRKHPPDKWVFVEECKTGATLTGPGHRSFDAWALRKSWTSLTMVGYEIKVSRSDFIRDDKWVDYLPFCNEFYFVVPPGVCDPGEVSEPAGLLISTKNGTRLFTKRKAQRRQIDIEKVYPLLVYILFWRTLVTGERLLQSGEDRAREFLAQKEENTKLGYMVSQKIREHVRKVETENDRLKRENSHFADVKRYLLANGVSERDIAGASSFRITNKFDRLRRENVKGIPDGWLQAIQDGINSLTTLKRVAEKVAAGGEDGEEGG